MWACWGQRSLYCICKVSRRGHARLWAFLPQTAGSCHLHGVQLSLPANNRSAHRRPRRTMSASLSARRRTSPERRFKAETIRGGRRRRTAARWPDTDQYLFLMPLKLAHSLKVGRHFFGTILATFTLDSDILIDVQCQVGATLTSITCYIVPRDNYHSSQGPASQGWSLGGFGLLTAAAEGHFCEYIRDFHLLQGDGKLSSASARLSCQNECVELC